jgi:HSP20 family protein
MGSQPSKEMWRGVRSGTGWNRGGGPAEWHPRADICETSEAVFIEVEVPGLREEDLSLYFEPGILIIEGKRQRPDHGSPRRCWQVEIEYGRLHRVLPLPKDTDGTRIEAHLENGMLAIRAPRRASLKTEHIQITIT